MPWNTANDAVRAEGQLRRPERFDEMRVIGVDEYVWRHFRTEDKYVTVITKLTPIAEGAAPARLLDMVAGRSKAVFKSWPADRDQGPRNGVEVVAMDGFTGFKAAAAGELPKAVEVMDPFHVVRLASEALDKRRQRIQQHTCGHRGRKAHPLYAARRTLLTGDELLTEKQDKRLEELFANEQHESVEPTWSVYQRLVDAYRQPVKKIDRWSMGLVIDPVKTKVPQQLSELASLGRMGC